jgi:hypothetical protein
LSSSSSPAATASIPTVHNIYSNINIQSDDDNSVVAAAISWRRPG